MPVDAYNASIIILKCLHTYYAQNYASIIYLPLVIEQYQHAILNGESLPCYAKSFREFSTTGGGGYLSLGCYILFSESMILTQWKKLYMLDSNNITLYYAQYS